MTTFNKILIENIDKNTISKENILQILDALNTICENEKLIDKLKIERQHLENELFFIKSKNFNSEKVEMNNEINVTVSNELEFFKENLFLKEKIYKILIKVNPQLSKSSVTKYIKKLGYLNNKKVRKEREIFNCKEEIKFLKNNQKIKSNTESYLNNLERKILPQIEKEILTQQFYINLFSKEGR